MVKVYERWKGSELVWLCVCMLVFTRIHTHECARAACQSQGPGAPLPSNIRESLTAHMHNKAMLLQRP